MSQKVTTIFKRRDGVQVRPLSEVHTNYFAKLKAGQLLTEEGLAETSPIMRRWWRDGYDAQTASQDRAMAALVYEPYFPRPPCSPW